MNNCACHVLPVSIDNFLVSVRVLRHTMPILKIVILDIWYDNKIKQGHITVKKRA